MGMASANPAAGLVGCPSGWDQLLPPSQRARALEARGCSASAQAPAALADQLSIYALPVTHGPLGPLAEPGARRAEAVRTYLIQRGVPAGRIDTISFGKERPIAEGSNEGAWAQNRNAHTAIVSGAPR